jgi:hypothetical protein
MHMAMRTPMTRMRFRTLFVGLAAWVALDGFVSCSSSDQAPGEGRVEHPSPSAKAPTPATSLAPPSEATPKKSESLLPLPSPSEGGDAASGFMRSPLDKAIAEDYPSRPWSKDVPKRRCTNDNECSDGFCDRGSCAAIWTWAPRYGQRCESDRWCARYPCIDGRCRSCLSDAECAWVRHMQDPQCTPDPEIPGSRECRGVVGSGPIHVSPGPPPQKPKQ